jgi:hypothetical protein
MSNSELIRSYTVTDGQNRYQEKDFLGLSRNTKWMAYRRTDGGIDMVRRRYGKLNVYETSFTTLEQTSRIDLFRIKDPGGKKRERKSTVVTENQDVILDRMIRSAEKKMEELQKALLLPGLPNKEWFKIQDEINSLSVTIELKRRQRYCRHKEEHLPNIELTEDVKF